MGTSTVETYKSKASLKHIRNPEPHMLSGPDLNQPSGAPWASLKTTGLNQQCLFFSISLLEGCTGSWSLRAGSL